MADPGQLSTGLAETAPSAAEVTPTGSTRADAFLLDAILNSAAGDDTVSGRGVILPNISTGEDVFIFNEGAATIQIYAQGAQTIDGTAGATGVSLPAADRAAFYRITEVEWLSALLGDAV